MTRYFTVGKQSDIYKQFEAFDAARKSKIWTVEGFVKRFRIESKLLCVEKGSISIVATQSDKERFDRALCGSVGAMRRFKSNSKIGRYWDATYGTFWDYGSNDFMRSWNEVINGDGYFCASYVIETGLLVSVTCTRQLKNGLLVPGDWKEVKSRDEMKKYSMLSEEGGLIRTNWIRLA